MSALARTLIAAALVAMPCTAWGRAPLAASDPVLPRAPALRLDDPLLNAWPLLDRYGHPSVERQPASARFLAGPWGMARWNRDAWKGLDLEEVEAQVPDWPQAQQPAGLSWLGGIAQDQVLPLALLPGAETPAWEWDGLLSTPTRCAKPPVRFLRHGAESDRFALLRCDGSVDAEAIDRLSLMARPVGVRRPALPLPDQPDEEAEQGAWVPSIRLVHPRLVWLVQQIANAYPGRALYIISGYRPGAHEGHHGKGRAVDLSVVAVAKEEVYALCRKLPDVGCGYYPNHDFVHVDVRAPGTGHAYWIDDSQPGEPSHYVDSWPGVEISGAAAWLHGGRSGPEATADAAR
jgi:hypothetical protein